MSNIGNITVKVVLDNAEFNQKVKSMPSEMNSVGNKLSGTFSKIGSAVASAFSVAVITKFTKTMVQSAAKVQASNSQMEQTFGDLSDTASAAMKKVADESGIVETRLQGVGTSIYAFAKTTGMDSATALTMMQEALQVTADSAAYYDRSLEDTAESLKSFLKGNYANDAALGLSCTETTRNTTANKLYGKSFKDLSESQKQLTLLQMVKDANEASGALGQAARESNGLENVLGNLKEAWNQLIAVVGKPILNAAVTVIQKITAAITALTEKVKVAVSYLSDVFGWDSDSTAESVQLVSNAVSDTTDNQEDLTTEVKNTNEEVKRGVASFDRLNIISESSSSSDDDSDSFDSSDVASSITNLTAQAENTVESLSDKIKNSFKNLYEKSGMKTFVDEIQDGINQVNWSAIRDNCQSAFNSSIPIAQAASVQMENVSIAAAGAAGSAFGNMISITGKSAQIVTGGISEWLKHDQNKIIGFINTIGFNFSRGFNNLNRFFDKMGSNIGDSIDRMRPRVQNSIANLLSGLTDFAGGVGTVVSGAFAVSSESLVRWAKKDAEEIGKFFDNLQIIGADVMDFFGTVFGDIGKSLSNWWNGDGAEIFSKVCDALNDIKTTLMNLWNDWIMPIWNFISGVFSNLWNNTLSPVFQKLISFTGKVGECFSVVWEKISPAINWFIDHAGPAISNVLSTIGGGISTFFSLVGDVLSGILDYFGGVLDFITGAFSGDWDKAWQGMKDSFIAVWEIIWDVIKSVVNAIIDTLNLLWTGIYNVVSAIVNAFGGNMSSEVTLIPKIEDDTFTVTTNNRGASYVGGSSPIPHFATGAVVKAPTLAWVGDNSNASSGNPEIVAPLSDLNSMISTNNEYDTTLLSSILDYLKRLYELFIIFRNNGGNSYQFVAQLDGETLFEEFVDQVHLYKQRHRGTLPW